MELTKKYRLVTQCDDGEFIEQGQTDDLEQAAEHIIELMKNGEGNVQIIENQPTLGTGFDCH